MKRSSIRFVGLAALAALMVLLAGCSTLDVKFPSDMFVSPGDYVPGIKTLGIIQASTTVFAPLFLFDINKVNQGLYDKLLQKAKAAGADGVTNIRFYSKVSPFVVLSAFIASGVFDFYVDGVVIRKQ